MFNGRPLNTLLYNGLVRRFGSVKVINPGREAVELQSVTLNGVKIDYKFGEYYTVNCPWCGDTRHRLYISYMWGMFDPEVGNKHKNLIWCQSGKGCYKGSPARIDQLDYEVYGAMPHQIRTVQNIAKGVAYASTDVVEPPGAVIALRDLPSTHPAVQYLGIRGFNPTVLSDLFGVGYCEEAAPLYPLMQGRIVIPVYTKGRYVGWQGRYVGDIDWKRFRTPKYYNSSQFPKSMHLYNYDNANRYRIVCLVEGVATVWSLGPQFTACFGSSVSLPQAQQAAELCREGYLVLLLDGDTWAVDSQTGFSKASRAIDILTAHVGSRLVVIRLPPEAKPDDYYPEALWGMIETALREKGWAGYPHDAFKTSAPGASYRHRVVMSKPT